MGLDAGIRVSLPEDSVIDIAALEEEATDRLVAWSGGTNRMYCLPMVFRGDEPNEFFVMTQVINWGGPLEEAGYQICEGNVAGGEIRWVAFRGHPSPASRARMMA